MFWLGDQLTTYDACDGLQSALIGSMSGGLSGWTLNHADIGGFTMIDRLLWLPLDIHFVRDQEQNIRWLEISVFINAIYRSHPGLIPNSSSQLWDSNMLNYTKRLTDLFSDLRPYRRFLFDEAASKGLPLVRHGILVAPHDPAWFNASAAFVPDHCKSGNEIGLSQFYFGDEVIVAPAMRSGVTEVYAYIPSGAWTHFWTNQTVQGPSYNSWKAPLGQPVFFYRESGEWTDYFRRLSGNWTMQKHNIAREALLI
jgi:alpha-glucosidase